VAEDGLTILPVTYLQLAPGALLPSIAHLAPFRAVVVLEAEVSPAWQFTVSDWLVRSGCLYMLAWGTDCASWDDSVDIANIVAFDLAEIPKTHSVMTTWHAQQSLSEVLYFSKTWAKHPVVDLRHALLLHIAPYADEARIVAAYLDS
jgi:hypothetical protein